MSDLPTKFVVVGHCPRLDHCLVRHKTPHLNPTPTTMGQKKRTARSPACRDEYEIRLRRHAKRAVQHWIAVANDKLIPEGVMPIPAVRFDLRGRTAGQWVRPHVHPKHKPTLVRINADLLVRYPKEMIQETVPHEVAHAVTNYIWGAGVNPHGAEWKSVMHAFGKEPTRCHTMQTRPARRTRRYEYYCKCERTLRLSAIRHGRIKRGEQTYYCRRCNAELTFTGLTVFDEPAPA